MDNSTYKPFNLPLVTPIYDANARLADAWINYWNRVATKAGRSLSWRGTWDSTLDYKVNELVLSANGATVWLAVQGNTGSEPSADSKVWQFLFYVGASASLDMIIDGRGSVPSTGSKGFYQVPFDCTITGWTILADLSGSAQVTVKKSDYATFPVTSSIVGALPPKLTAAQKNTSGTLTGWTVELSAGDVLEYNLDSVATSTWLILQLAVTKH